MATKKITITRRHMLGYGWTNSLVRDPRDNGSIVAEPRQEITGRYAQIAEERARAIRINSGGTSWRDQLFVDGKPVVERPYDVLLDLEISGSAEVTVRE